MSWRFRKRVKLAPGLYLNASFSGLGMSVGPRGANVSFGPRGTYANASIPGTGLYSRQRIGGGRSRGPGQGNLRAQAKLAKQQQLVSDLNFLADNPPLASVEGQEGPIQLKTQNGQVLDERLSQLAWKHAGDTITSSVTSALDDRRRQIDQLGELHLTTPAPTRVPQYAVTAFNEPPPIQAAALPYHWFWRLFPQHRRRVDALNQANADDYQEDLTEWEAEKQTHEQREAGRSRMYAIRDRGGKAAVEGFLLWHFENLEWPRETEVAFSLSADAQELWLDVDLPEIEDFLEGYQEATAKGRAVRWKKMPDAARRTLYMHHVHGIGLRLAGEAFAHVRSLEVIYVAGFSQRTNRQTGTKGDEYLYSSRIDRTAWSQIEFTRLTELDPVAAYERFDTRRKVTKTGIFKPIEPHSAPAD